MNWLLGGSPQTQTSSTENKTSSLGFDPNEVSNVSSFLNQPGIFDSQRLHPLAGLDKGVEYLDLEEEQLTTVEGAQGLIPSRNWSDDLCYGTGAVYLLGLGIGGAYGLQEGLKNLPAGSSGRLKLNTVLNHITKRGPFLGNSAGVLALTYNLIDSSIDAIRGKHDELNSIGAGAIAGAIFRSSAGVRPMAYSTLLMTGAAASWCGIKRFLQ